MEVLIAVITAAGVVLAAVIPALLTMRRTRGAVVTEGETTRDAMTGAVEALGSRLDARIEDVRDDLDDVRERLARVREWQAGHDAEHLLIGRPQPGNDS
ncbi:hypothetical protein J7I94_19120 [Streptomyces sp. ISL-12]|uniref:hypothetical protein n=1 Tax=Streptomyces sp. ISL-12 TaxID=2819177 RepID=UPI001BE6209A|nr:hypothetical protein [Streptomyces sp. ISL-12]MBT2412646.1 hypothetical protein [Streptomyces sp. ISL-12]